LRVLADQPATEFNRVPLAERHIDQYLRAKMPLFNCSWMQSTQKVETTFGSWWGNTFNR
jgi:hypothetical protein